MRSIPAAPAASQRESGQLKRLRGTPMLPWTFIVANVLRSGVLVLAMVCVLFLIGVLAFGVHLHGAKVLGMAIYTGVGIAALSTLGLAITIVCSSTESASAVGPFAAVILSFISGAFIPISVLPSWLQTVGKAFPLSHLATGLQRGVAKGTGLTASDIGTLLAWALAGLVVAAWGFKWEPQSARG